MQLQAVYPKRDRLQVIALTLCTQNCRVAFTTSTCQPTHLQGASCSINQHFSKHRLATSLPILVGKLCILHDPTQLAGKRYGHSCYFPVMHSSRNMASSAIFYYHPSLPLHRPEAGQKRASGISTKRCGGECPACAIP